MFDTKYMQYYYMSSRLLGYLAALDCEMKLQTAIAALTASEEEVRRLRIKIAGMEEQASSNLRRVQEDHQEQLSRVDRKVLLLAQTQRYHLYFG